MMQIEVVAIFFFRIFRNVTTEQMTDLLDYVAAICEKKQKHPDESKRNVSVIILFFN